MGMWRHGVWILAILGAGCATQVNPAPDLSKGTLPLSFQRPALSPRDGGVLVDESALQPGDILLSAADGLTSVGIRAFTLSTVSHAALYIGNGEVAEAVGAGVHVRSVPAVLEEESVVVALRHPRIDAEIGDRIRSFATSKVGLHYNHFGIVMQAPFSVERRLCEVPGVPDAMRDACIRGIATVQLGQGSEDRFFCSQFVLEAYREAGLPITEANPYWLSPSDILHMREGDVPSVRIEQPLMYVGHLKFPVGGISGL